MRSTGYVVIELKTGKFQPGVAGKLNFYVSLVDDVLRRDHHNETIGILICAAYTCDKLPSAEQQVFPDEGHIVAALEWAEPETIAGEA